MLYAIANPTMERVARRALSLTEAGVASEDILIAWLVGLPEGANVSRAATQLVARLDNLDPLSGAGDGRLRDLLLETARSATGMGSRNRNPNRWRN